MREDFVKMVKGMLDNIDVDIQSLTARLKQLEEVRTKVSGLLEYVKKGDDQDENTGTL